VVRMVICLFARVFSFLLFVQFLHDNATVIACVQEIDVMYNIVDYCLINRLQFDVWKWHKYEIIAYHKG